MANGLYLELLSNITSIQRATLRCMSHSLHSHTFIHKGMELRLHLHNCYAWLLLLLTKHFIALRLPVRCDIEHMTFPADMSK